ncbi:MAG: phosphate-starvation-inducible PsiE family protein [Candidatus Electrothrix sp. YB6]
MKIISEKIKAFFDTFVNLVFGVILLFMIIGMAIGTAQLFFTTWRLFTSSGITGHYINLITDILTLYVLIELSRSLVDYFNVHKLRLTYILDAALVFVLREALISLFKHEIKPDMIYAFSTLLFVLGALRIGSILLYQREKLLL